MGEDVRAHVVIKGRVQGVFFRAETQKAAMRIGVKGWVRNKSDGTVEAVFEGPETIVNQALDWCRNEGSPMSQVTDVEVQYGTPTDEFDSFSITY
jgi:acylphosphatase